MWLLLLVFGGLCPALGWALFSGLTVPDQDASKLG